MKIAFDSRFYSTNTGALFFHFNGVSGHELKRSDQTAGRRTNRIPTADVARVEPRGADAVCLGAPAGLNPLLNYNQRKDPSLLKPWTNRRGNVQPQVLRLDFAFYRGFIWFRTSCRCVLLLLVQWLLYPPSSFVIIGFRTRFLNHSHHFAASVECIIWHHFLCVLIQCLFYAPFLKLRLTFKNRTV